MKTLNILQQLQISTKYIQKRISSIPKVAVIIGSGLGNIKKNIENSKIVSYDTIPYFKQSTVKGHKGELVFGKLNDVDIVLLNGRLHYYEGYSMYDVSYPVRVMKALGIETIIITCAVGAINKKYSVGDIILVKDHINFMFDNPLIGKNYKEFGERFPDLSNIYDEKLRQDVLQIARKNKITVHEGIYFAVTGPSYETPSEVLAFKKLGADVVGMSLVGESIVAKQMGMNVLALAYVSNYASGISKQKLYHKDVLSLGNKTTIIMEKIISNILKAV